MFRNGLLGLSTYCRHLVSLFLLASLSACGGGSGGGNPPPPDTNPPDTNISSTPASATNSTNASFEFTSTEAGSTFRCSLDGAALVNCTSPTDYVGLTAGTHTFSVEATDAAGNTDPTPATYTWTIDLTTPDTSITSSPASLTNSISASFAFTSTEAGSTFQCSLDGGALANCTSLTDYVSLAAGTHTFSVAATDVAGNTDPSPATYSWDIDTTAPDTIISSAPTSLTNSTGASFAFTSTEAGSTFQCSLDGGALTNCTSPDNYAGLAIGNHTFTVAAIDAAGNTDPTPATYNWAIDLIAPNTSITSAPADPTNSTSASFAFTSTEAGSTFQCSLDGGALANCTSPTNYVSLAVGTHTFSVAATDVAGNTDPSPATYSWDIDTAAPDTIISSAPADPTNSTSASFVFTSTEAGSTFQCSLDGGALTNCTSPDNYAGLAEGDHTFSVTATNGAGNTDPIAATHNWTIDLTPPVISVPADILVPADDASGTPATNLAIQSFLGGATATDDIDGDLSGSISDDAPSTFPIGITTVTFSVNDAAGNTASNSSTVEVTAGDSTAPDTTSIVINSNAQYAIFLNEFTARLIALDNFGVTGYLITEHNATDPFNIIPAYLDPLPSNVGWVAVAETAILDITIQVPLTRTYSVGETVELCAWFMDAQANISERVCDSIIYGFDSESGIGNWSADNGVWQLGAPTVVGPASCFSGSLCFGTILDGNYPANTDSRLVSASFQLPTVAGLDEIHLRFQQWFSYGSGDSGQVQISVWDAVNSTWGNWQSEGATVGIGGTGVPAASGGWSLKGVDLTAYSGERIRLGFLHTVDTNFASSGWYIDDITVEQTTPTFTGSFESGWDDWSAGNGVWQVGAPTAAGPTSCFSGGLCVGTVQDGNYPANTDSRLVSASFQLPTVAGLDEIHLRFQQWFSYARTGDSGQVQIAIWDAATSTWGSWLNEGTAVADASGGWSLKGVDLTAYSGERIRLGFLHTVDTNFAGSGWYIDDMTVEQVTPAFSGSFEAGWDDWSADVGVWQVGAPTLVGPASCFSGSQCVGTVLDGNYPANTDSRLVSASLQLPTVAGLDEIHLRFQQWFDYTNGDSGQVQISVWDGATSTWGSWLNEDTAVTNKSGGWSLKGVDLTAYSGETVRIGFLHSADTNFASSGWYIDDVTVDQTTPLFTGTFEAGWDDWSADVGLWQVGTPTLVGPASCFSGTQCVGTVLDGNYPFDTDSRLVSASLQLPTVAGLDEIHLRFQHWSAFNRTFDSGQVQISIWNAVTLTWGSWLSEGIAVTEISGGWSLKDVDLTAYSGERVRIGFLHTAEQISSFVSLGWYIDDITVEQTTPTFTGDFEAGWVDWSADNGVWQVGTPTLVGPASCFSGTECAATILDGNYPPFTDSHLVSASLQLPTVTGVNTIHLRFQQWFDYTNGDSGQVQISVWNAVTSTWGSWVSEGTAVANASGGWSVRDVDLTTYSGETVRIGFLHSADTSFESSGWYVDDIGISVF